MLSIRYSKQKRQK